MQNNFSTKNKERLFKRKVNHQLQNLHYQKLGVLLAEPKSEKRDILIHAIKEKLKILDEEGWQIIKTILKL